MNRYLQNKKNWGFILLALLLTAQTKAQPQNDKASLSVHGAIYPNSCNEDQQKKLRSILSKSSALDPDKAWRAIETFLCSTRNDMSINTALTFSKSEIKNNYEEAGVSPDSRVVKSTKETIESLMANGNAWDVEIDANRNKLKVSYLKDEACIEILIFKFHSAQWYLSEFSAACD